MTGLSCPDSTSGMRSRANDAHCGSFFLKGAIAQHRAKDAQPLGHQDRANDNSTFDPPMVERITKRPHVASTLQLDSK